MAKGYAILGVGAIKQLDKIEKIKAPSAEKSSTQISGNSSVMIISSLLAQTPCTFGMLKVKLNL